MSVPLPARSLDLNPTELNCGMWGGNVAQLVRAPDCHATDAGLISQCGEGFFSQSQLSVQTLSYVCPYTPVCNLMH